VIVLTLVAGGEPDANAGVPFWVRFACATPIARSAPSPAAGA
jgi:hypothetical protein